MGQPAPDRVKAARLAGQMRPEHRAHHQGVVCRLAHLLVEMVREHGGELAGGMATDLHLLEVIEFRCKRNAGHPVVTVREPDRLIVAAGRQQVAPASVLNGCEVDLTAHQQAPGLRDPEIRVPRIRDRVHGNELVCPGGEHRRQLRVARQDAGTGSYCHRQLEGSEHLQQPPCPDAHPVSLGNRVVGVKRKDHRDGKSPASRPAEPVAVDDRVRNGKTGEHHAVRRPGPVV